MYEVEWYNEFLREINHLYLQESWSKTKWFVTGCYGIMNNGDEVRVLLPVDFFKKGSDTGSVIPSIIDAARGDKVHAEGLGIFRDGVIVYER